jgi:hypothetical protein
MSGQRGASSRWTDVDHGRGLHAPLLLAIATYGGSMAQARATDVDQETCVCQACGRTLKSSARLKSHTAQIHGATRGQAKGRQR